MNRTPYPPRTPELQRAYDECRAIAKREARNFYYAFLVLPKHKSDAMCAIYAFMRKADDLSDDESLTVTQRREAMAAWTAALRRARTEPTADPIFLAVNDTQHLFGIPDTLLDQLVEGTTMDLRERLPGVIEMQVASRGLQVYESFDALYHYCYLVASVVGLVCIRIFGYTDPRAEQLAEKTGVAFQLTNILRDVKEDAERGRIYLPIDDMHDAGVTVDGLLQACSGSAPSPVLMTLLDREMARAQEYYLASDELIPLLDADSREAMRVLAAIYHRLLDRIESDPAAIFRERVSVPTVQKLTMLGRGMLRAFLARGRE